MNKLWAVGLLIASTHLEAQVVSEKRIPNKCKDCKPQPPATRHDTVTITLVRPETTVVYRDHHSSDTTILHDSISRRDLALWPIGLGALGVLGLFGHHHSGERTDSIFIPSKPDTIHVPQVRYDTTFVPRTDTLRIITTKLDTVLIQKVDTIIKQHTDTLRLPSGLDTIFIRQRYDTCLTPDTLPHHYPPKHPPVTTTPEPSTFILAGSGIAAVLIARRRNLR